MLRHSSFPVNCPICGKEFLTRESRLRTGHGKFCSRSCARKAQDHPTIPLEIRIERFWNAINRNGPLSESCPERGQCWEQQNVKRGNTYFAWEILVGPRTDNGLYILHHCDNGLCVRADPDPEKSHLYLGTPKQNMEDMYNRGRAAKAVGWQRHSFPGEQNGNSRLTEVTVYEIRERWPNLKGKITIGQFAEEYKIGYSTMKNIIHRRVWDWVE